MKKAKIKMILKTAYISAVMLGVFALTVYSLVYDDTIGRMKVYQFDSQEPELQSFIRFSSIAEEIFFGRIESPKDMREKAESFWLEIEVFTEEEMKERRRVVYYDAVYDLWLVNTNVRGTWPPTRYYLPTLVVRGSDGKVMSHFNPGPAYIPSASERYWIYWAYTEYLQFGYFFRL